MPAVARYAASLSDLRRRGGRRWWLAGAAVIAAVAVLMDLPVHGGAGYRRTQLRSFLAAAHSDVAACSAGLRDALDAYTGWVAGTPNHSRGTAGDFSRQAIAVCGFADSGVVDLGSKAPPRSVASPTVDRIGPQLDAWAYLDAFTLLQDLRTLIARPSSAADRHAVDADLAQLRRRRATVERLVEAAERSRGLPPRPLPLVDATSRLHGDAVPTGGAG